jgi:hypothetical protein
VDLTVSKLNVLLGFNSAIYTQTTTGQQQAQITTISLIQIQCSLIAASFSISPSGSTSNNIYSFNMNAPLGAQMVFQIYKPVFIPVGVKEFKEITIGVVDQNNNPINFNNYNSNGAITANNPLALFLELRPRSTLI